MRRGWVYGILLLVIALAGACRHKPSEELYFDYRVSGEEGQDNVVVMLRYQPGGPDGPAVELKTPAKTELDGQLLQADSAGLSGTFYEAIKPADAFAGTHTILHTAADGKPYREDFTFRPLTLLTPFPDVVIRGDLVLELEGVNTGDPVRVLLMDTSLAGREISRLDTVRDGRLLISRQDLGTLSDGPILMELAREESRPIKNGTRSGGRFNSTYILKREFELKTRP